MAVTLGCGDAFHLVPCAIALCTTGLPRGRQYWESEKLITSVTMTVFYVLLYYVWRIRYQISGKGGITAAVWIFPFPASFYAWCRRTPGHVPMRLSWESTGTSRLHFGTSYYRTLLPAAKETQDHGPSACSGLPWYSASPAIFRSSCLRTPFPAIGILMIENLRLRLDEKVVIGYRAMKKEKPSDLRKITGHCAWGSCRKK